MTEKGWMGEVAKIPDPGIGWPLVFLEERCRQGGASAGEIDQAVIFPSLPGRGFLKLGKVHMGGEILLPGFGEGMSGSLMIPHGHQGPTSLGR